MIEKFYLGTYTKRKSKGIYSVELNTETKTLNNLTLEAVVNNPTYLAISHTHQLAAVSKEDDHGGLTLFNIEDGQLSRVAHHHDTTAVPCYVAYNNSADVLLAANYHEGHVSLYKVADELQLLDRVQHTGSSTHANQDHAHVHFTDYTPDGRWMIVCDLGTDTVVTYQQNGDKLEEVARYHALEGSGPRHISFHPTLNVAYIICELNATIEVVHYDSATGTFSFMERHALTKGDEQKWGGAIHTTSDGQFVYATNRGYDRIYVFKTDAEDGRLTLVADYSTFGSVARDFNFDATEQFIIIGHQESDNLTLYERDVTTGTLTLCERDFFAPEVVCVKQA